MALRYEFSVDSGLIKGGGFAVAVNDGTDSGTATVTDETLYCHTDITSVLGSGIGKSLAVELDARLDAVLATWGATVSLTGNTYRVQFVGASTMDFRSATLGDNSGINLAKWLGFTADHPDGSGTGYDCLISGGSSKESNVRPYGIILPTIQGRSEVEDEYEPEGLTQEAEADDGTAYYVSKDGSSTWVDWSQTAETGTPPATFSDDGMPVFKREETSAVPWSYQRAFEHIREGGYPFLVVDGSDSEVHQMRAEGTSFHPARFASKDYALWTVEFKTRLIGRLT